MVEGKHRYIDPEAQYVFIYLSTLCGPSVYSNTKLVNLDSLRSVWDLLDPKWKGKMIALWPRANYVSTALLFMYHHPQVGPKFLERLYGGEMDLTYFSDFRQGTDWLAHDHGDSWAIYGQAVQHTEMSEWKRTDDGSTPGKATIEKARTYRLQRGQAGIFQNRAIHSIAYPAGARFIRVTGTNLENIARGRYNSEAGTMVVEKRPNFRGAT